MRRRELALTQPHRDGRLELGELDDLDLAGRPGGCLPRGRDGARRRGPRLALLLGGSLDIFFGDPSTGAGALDAAQIDAVFFGEAPGDGGDPLALTVLLHGGTANHVDGSLRRRAAFGPA